MPSTDSFSRTAISVAALQLDAAELAQLPDASLLAAVRVLAEHRRATELLEAELAGEVQRRSRPETRSRLAQRNGFGSAEGLLQSLSPVTRAEATRLVNAGALLEPEGQKSLWQAALARGLRDGRLSVASADAIRAGLESASDSAPAGQLRDACERLIGRASLISIDELRREARSARDRLDEAGVERREIERRDLRYLKRWIRGDGMYQGTFLLDPENGQRVFSALDAIVAPRRPVRFSSTGDAEKSREASAGEVNARDDAVTDDPRTLDQRLADALVDLTQVAIDADPGRLFGDNRPAVRVIVAAESLGERGHGFIEGDDQPVSHRTIDRFVCDSGLMPITVDTRGQVLNLGRSRRLFSNHQRLALAVRDGGCLFPGCTKPPSQCEAHHITEWRNGGRTDLRDGVLLCRHHHLMVHNNGWRIVRRDDHYWLRSPHVDDPDKRLRMLRSKSAAMREVIATG